MNIIMLKYQIDLNKTAKVKSQECADQKNIIVTNILNSLTFSLENDSAESSNIPS